MHKKFVWSCFAVSLALLSSTGWASKQQTLIEVNDGGNMVMIWTEFDKTWSVVGCSTINGGSWNMPEVLSDTKFQSENPILEMNANGDCVAIWTTHRTDLGIYALYCSTLTPGNIWSESFQLSSNNEKVINGSHSVSMNNSGVIVVTWQSEIEGSITTRIASKVSGTNWTTPASGP